MDLELLILVTIFISLEHSVEWCRIRLKNVLAGIKITFGAMHTTQHRLSNSLPQPFRWRAHKHRRKAMDTDIPRRSKCHADNSAPNTPAINSISNLFEPAAAAEPFV